MNPDGSHASTVLAHSTSTSASDNDGALVLTGDVDAYNRAHPDAPVSEVVSARASLSPSLAYWQKTASYLHEWIERRTSPLTDCGCMFRLQALFLVSS